VEECGEAIGYCGLTTRVYSGLIFALGSEIIYRIGDLLALLRLIVGRQEHYACGFDKVPKATA
jgi:hypothetical protein